MMNDSEVVFIRWEDYHGKESALTRLWVHRIRKFTYGVLKFLDIDSIEGRLMYDYVQDTVGCVLGLMDFKLRLKVSIYDLAITCMWVTARRYGLGEIDPKVLISIAKYKLNKKVRLGKILRIMSYVRKKFMDQKITDTRREILEYFRIYLDRLSKDAETVAVPNWHLFRLKLITDAVKVLDLIGERNIVGTKRRVLAAALLYALIRGYKIELLNSKHIERATGVSRFTILKKYSMLRQYITKIQE